MKLLVFTGWLLIACSVLGQSNPLPYVHDGKWSLIDTNGNVLQKTDYSYIHTFDEVGYTFFCEKGAYGIMNRSGEIVLEPIYADIQQKGYGHYQVYDNNGWIPFEPNGFRLVGNDTVQSFETLSSTWALAGINDNWYLEHLQTGNRWLLKDSIASYRLLHDHLWLQQGDTDQLLINGNGKLVFSGKLRIRSQNELYDITHKETHYLFDARGSWHMTEIEEVTYEENTVFVKTKKEGFYCSYDGSVFLRGNYEEITEFNQQYLQVRRDGLVALVDRKTRQQVIPFLYENIYPRLEGGYTIEFEDNTGLLDEHFNTIIPCKYQRFTINGQLARVYEVNYVGIYSLKTKKEILPPVYNSITQSGNRYKAIRNDLITLIELNDKHAIVKKAKIDNAIMVRSLNEQFVGSIRPKFIDPRLYALGWFLDSSLITPPAQAPFYSVKWGLRNNNDSMLITARLSNLNYIPLAPFTMLPTGSIDFPYGKAPYRQLPNCYPIYLPTGKIMSGLAIISYDSTDFRRRAFMRASTVYNLGILKADGSYKPYDYIEKSTNRYLLICETPNVEVTETKLDEMTEITTLNFSGPTINHPAFERNFRTKPKMKGFIYPKGKWNYLKPDGTSLFKESFSFAQAFLGNQALVKQGKKWGVVNSDSLIVPAIYTSIERKVIDCDTFFIAKQAQNGTRLLDTTGKVLEGYTVFATKGNQLILESSGKKQLCDIHFKSLSDAYSNMKFLKNGFILAKNKKEFTLMNAVGSVLYVGPKPPDDVLCSSYLIYKKGGSFTIRDLSENSIVEGCSSVEEQGNYLLFRKDSKLSIMDQYGTLILDGINGSALVDTLGNYLAIVQKGKTIIYKGALRLHQIKQFTPTHFIAGKLIVNSTDSCVIYSITGQQEQVLPAVQSFELLKDGSIFLETVEKVNVLFDPNWIRILPEEHTFRGLIQLAPAIYAYTIAEGRMVLYNDSTQIADSSYQICIGRFEEDRLLVKKQNRYCYINSHFKPITTRTFRQAIPFSGNFAAVSDQRGWTLIDQHCNSLTYPNYGAIAALNSQLFKTERLPFYGVYDTRGNLLIPVEYEQISFLPHGIIQCVKNGELYYFRKNGTHLLSTK